MTVDDWRVKYEILNAEADQQRAEAAAEALDEFADEAGGIEELITCNISDLQSALRARAAALRAGEVGNE